MELYHIFTMDKRNRFAPVSLTREYPVTELVVDSLFTDTHLLDDMRSSFFRTADSIPFQSPELIMVPGSFGVKLLSCFQIALPSFAITWIIGICQTS